jgi:hypothetical protein
MTGSLPPAFIAIVAVLAAGLLLALGVRVGLYFGRRRAEREMEDLVARERSDAIKRSRAVLGGQFSEQLAPFLPLFPGDPTECRFIGKPVDFVSFAGASQGSIDEVVFIEVKTGDSRLSPVERSLRAAIERGAVRYVEYRVPARSEARGRAASAQTSADARGSTDARSDVDDRLSTGAGVSAGGRSSGMRAKGTQVSGGQRSTGG